MTHLAAYLVAALLIVGWLTPASIAETLAGRVIGIHDGDTLTVLVDRDPVRVRLAWIDAPELGQAYGRVARQELDRLVYRREVVVDVTGQDLYGRILGTVWCGGQDVGLHMVRNGLAWAYRRFKPPAGVMGAEDYARAHSLGLWALQGDQQIPPWEWRHDR